MSLLCFVGMEMDDPWSVFFFFFFFFIPHYFHLFIGNISNLGLRLTVSINLQTISRLSRLVLSITGKQF